MRSLARRMFTRPGTRKLFRYRDFLPCKDVDRINEMANFLEEVDHHMRGFRIYVHYLSESGTCRFGVEGHWTRPSLGTVLAILDQLMAEGRLPQRPATLDSHGVVVS